MPEENQAELLQFAQMLSKFEGMERRFEKMESKLDQIVALDKTISELTIHRESDRSAQERIHERIDGLTTWKDQYVVANSEAHAKIIEALDANCKSFSAACVAIEGKVDGWVNRGRGAFWAGTLFMGLIQVIMIAGISWTINSIGDLNDRVYKVEAHYEIHVDHPEAVKQ